MKVFSIVVSSTLLSGVDLVVSMDENEVPTEGTWGEK